MSRSLKYDIPGRDWRVTVDDVRAKGLEGIFAGDVPPPLPLVLEIGFGRGEFLFALATAGPTRAFLGVEYSAKRVLKTARRLARSELHNVRLLLAPAEDVVRDLLPSGSLEAVWVNFPDPWPKKRHHKRRLLQARFVRALAGRLRSGGALHIATDHVGYAESVAEVLGAEPLLENLAEPARWLPEVPGRPPTAYELEWRAEGRALHFFEYRRRLARDAAALGQEGRRGARGG
ncbi:MAG: tRNA (guanosine(46)-N7)-methyltransferase TrmB [Myxococcota bacterium]